MGGDHDTSKGYDRMDREYWDWLDWAERQAPDDDEDGVARSKRCHPARDWL